ncbi:ammonium transporter [Candidatus Binatia bacterium]|nr:ammonium transporter [Candidatus Binatia bacterium]
MDTQTLNSGDTAWMLVSTALVLFMMVPGLALFYGGLVRTKNVLSVLMQCFALTALVTVLWVLYGYSLAFDATGMNPDGGGRAAVIGGLAKVFLRGIDVNSMQGTIPETVFVAYQAMFALITPGLIVGAFAERMRFSAMLVFSAIWFTFAYTPVCHMVWGGSGALMAHFGVIDFAGGIVVHITAGVAALVAALVIGARQGYPHTQMMPHNLTMTAAGTGMLWVGWFGFNAGSALAANGTAGMAALVTHISPCVAALTWMAIELIKFRTASMLGFATGAIAGLAAITPAAGTAGPAGAVCIGLASGAACFLGATSIKRWGGYDDSLDAFGVHGVGGFVGTVLAGIFAASELGGSVADLHVGRQFVVQIGCALAAAAWSAVVAFAALKVAGALVGLRVDDAAERSGLDLSLHNESGYNY